MESLKQLLKTGPGPSSSHTIGPMKASLAYLSNYSTYQTFHVELWGSLAATGKGHLTDYIVEKTFNDAGKTVTVIFNDNYTHPFHPNAMQLSTIDPNGRLSNQKIYFSIGGGSIIEEGGDTSSRPPHPYPQKNFKEIMDWLHASGDQSQLWHYAVAYEGEEILDYLGEIWQVIKSSVESGLSKDGVIPGVLHYPRRSKKIYNEAMKQTGSQSDLGKLFAYTLAVSEENASGSIIVTTPTCGAAGVLPGLLYYFYQKDALSDEQMVKALAAAGIVGLVIKTNASISGAEAGCQAEVGSACSMGAAAASYLLGATLAQMEYAIEMGLEHHLGLTCDPVAGLVQIPCIERNALASRRALDCTHYAMYTDGDHQVSFDTVVATMYDTGLNMKSEYRETSKGGLATHFYMEGS